MKSMKGPIAVLILICASLGTAAAQGKKEVTQPIHPASDVFFRTMAHPGSGGFVDAMLVKELHRLPGIHALAMIDACDINGITNACATVNVDTFCDCAQAAATAACGGDVLYFTCTPRGFVSCACVLIN